MSDVDMYLNSLPTERKEKLLMVITYIRNSYPTFIESCDYAPKTKFPVFKPSSMQNYVAIASQKTYIAVHFGRYHCAEIVGKANTKIKTRVACVNIPDTIPFPIAEIKSAIDICFKDC